MPHEAFFAEETGIDWNVIFLLLGMMIIVGVLRQTGVFEFLAIWAAKRAGGKPYRVMVMLVLITAVASAALDNVTTVLLVAPVTLLICERLGINPVPYLLAEVMASNIGGAATLIGDPPNIIIASRADLSFNDFLINMAPIVVVLLAVFVVMCRFMFRRAFVYHPERAGTGDGAARARRDHRPGAAAGARSPCSRLVLVGFVLHSAIHIEPSVVAMLGAGLLVAVSGARPRASTSPTSSGRRSCSSPGCSSWSGHWSTSGSSSSSARPPRMRSATTTSQPRPACCCGSAVLSGVVDNIPYVATMAPLVAGLVAGSGGSTQGGALWWALALGADLGGNATAVGASANVVVTGIAARNGHPISFWTFTKYGSRGHRRHGRSCACPYLWLRYYA